MQPVGQGPFCHLQCLGSCLNPSLTGSILDEVSVQPGLGQDAEHGVPESSVGAGGAAQGWGVPGPGAAPAICAHLPQLPPLFPPLLSLPGERARVPLER